MLYLGGKKRAGKPIAKAILSATRKRDVYLEPCLGGGSSFKLLAPHFKRSFAGDVHQDLMLMWAAAKDGWTPPDVVSESEYQVLRRKEPSALRGFVGFGCSFGGKWWGGYARSPQNGDGYYARHACKSIIEIASIMRQKSTTLARCSYEDWLVTPSTVAYVDPEYRNTTKFKDTGKMDHDHFWVVMDAWRNAGADVFVSEYAAPAHWQVLWQSEQTKRVSGGTGALVHEKLFWRP